jgi:hypothetical protein
MSSAQLQFVMSFDWLQLNDCIAYEFGCGTGKVLRSMSLKMGFGFDKNKYKIEEGLKILDRQCYDNITLHHHDLDVDGYDRLRNIVTHDEWDVAILHKPMLKLKTSLELCRLVDERAHIIVAETNHRNRLNLLFPNRKNYLIGEQVYGVLRK